MVKVVGADDSAERCESRLLPESFMRPQVLPGVAFFFGTGFLPGSRRCRSRILMVGCRAAAGPGIGGYGLAVVFCAVDPCCVACVS